MPLFSPTVDVGNPAGGGRLVAQSSNFTLMAVIAAWTIYPRPRGILIPKVRALGRLPNPMPGPWSR